MALLRYDNTHVTVSECDIDRDFDRQEIARVFVNRSLFDESDVEPGETDLTVVDDEDQADADARFGGVLRNVDRKGSVSEIIVESHERYSRDAPRTPAGERYENVGDTTVFEDAVASVDQLTTGTVEAVKAPVSMIYSHASPARKIRSLADTTGAEILYRPDKTCHYLDRRGSDRTHITLSPDNQNITGSFQADKLSGGEDITHLRLVGSGVGEAQAQVNFVPETDSYDYEGDDEYQNVVRYNASHWATGDRRKWDTKADKGQTSVDALERLGESLTEEYQVEHVEVETTVEGLDVGLGDHFTVNYPEEDVHDVAVRVVDLVEKFDSTGWSYQVTLSSRRHSRVDQGKKERDDVSNYNVAFEGTSVMPTASGGRQPVGSDQQGRNVNYEFDFYYPSEAVYEHRAKLHVKGYPYRAYSWGAEDNADFQRVSEEGFVTDHWQAVEGFLTTTDRWTCSVPTSEVRAWGIVQNLRVSDKYVFVRPYLRNNDTRTNFPGITHEVRLEPGAQVAVPMSDPTDCEGDTFDFRAEVTKIGPISEGAPPASNVHMSQGPPDVVMESANYTDPYLLLNVVYQAIGKHTHDPAPGVTQTFETVQHFPSECQVLVNGDAVGDPITGGFDFEAEVDLRGSLNFGEWNTVEITSDTLGAMQAHLDTDVTRQILGDG